MQDVKGLAVGVYAESLTTQQMRYHPDRIGKGKQQGDYDVGAGPH